MRGFRIPGSRMCSKMGGFPVFLRKLDPESSSHVTALSANQSSKSEILRPELGIVAQFGGQFQNEGDQRFGVVFSSAADLAGFSLWRKGSVPVAPLTFHRARWFSANGRRHVVSPSLSCVT
jgi:hypothetical protein